MHFDAKKQIYVTFQKEGIHQYPGAPEGVEFLQYPHRHMFHFKVHLEVFHDDRDVEFILFKRELQALYNHGIMNIDYMSCEMLAQELAKYIQTKYPNRRLKIDISEDGENGCLVEYEQEANINEKS